MDQQPVSLITHQLVFAVILFIFTPSAAFASTDFILPPDHRSIYTLSKYGSRVGEIHNELKQHNNLISYTSVAIASGFASLFVKEDITETSILSWSETQAIKIPQQQSYKLFRGKNHKKNQNITFNWTGTDAVKLNGTYKKHSYQLTSKQAVWSRHVLPLLISSDLQIDDDTSGSKYNITDRGRFQNYAYTLETTEDIRLAGNSYPTLKFKITRKHSNRISYAWLSKAHYYLPLKVEQYKDGKLNASMLMKQLYITKEDTQDD